MGLNYTIELRDSAIEVRVRGVPDRASLTRMWTDIMAAADRCGCLYILGLAYMDQPTKLADAIDHQAIFLEAGVTVDHRIAWVQQNPAAVEMSRLAETVLLNRGLASGRVFTDEFEARRWLANR